MKYLIAFFIIGLLCSACKRVENNNCSKENKLIDSLQTETSNLRKELAEFKSKKQTRTSNHEDFDSFLYSFMTDSLFQLRRTKFPLMFIHWKDYLPGDKIDTSYYEKDNWKHRWFYMIGYGEIPQLYDNYKMELRPTNERLLHFTGVETGTNSKYYFKLIDKKWYLIKMENLGD